MSGLAAPDASVPEKVISFALPLAAGAAAAIHPAGARGLAGLTSGVNTMLATREFGRREQADRDLGMKLSDLLDKPMGTATVPGDVSSDLEGTAQGPPLTVPGPKMSDALGAPQTAYLKTLLSTPGYAGTAAGIIASQGFPKPNYQVVHVWNNATKSLDTKLVDVNRQGGQTFPGKPEETTEEALAAVDKYRRGQAGQQPATSDFRQSSTAPPVAPTTTPPEAQTPDTSGTTALPAVGVTGTRTPEDVVSLTHAGGKSSVHVAPGTSRSFTEKKLMPDGRIHTIEYVRDQAGNMLGQRDLGEAPPGEGRDRAEAEVASMIGRDHPRFGQAVDDWIRLVPGNADEVARADAQARLVAAYGRRAADRPAPPPGSPAGAVSPSPGGALPPAVSSSEAPPGGVDYNPVTRQDALDAERTRQKARLQGAEKRATISAEESFAPRPGEAIQWIHKDDWTAPPSNMSTTAIKQSGKYVPIDIQRSRVVSQAVGVYNGMKELIDIANRRPDLFPVESGSSMKDAYNLAAAKTKWYSPASQDRDPDVRRLVTLTANMPNFIRALGDNSGNVAVAERAITELAVGLHPAMRQATLASVETLQTLVNSGLLKGTGLSAMPSLSEPPARPDLRPKPKGTPTGQPAGGPPPGFKRD